MRPRRRRRLGLVRRRQYTSSREGTLISSVFWPDWTDGLLPQSRWNVRRHRHCSVRPHQDPASERSVPDEGSTGSIGGVWSRGSSGSGSGERTTVAPLELCRHWAHLEVRARGEGPGVCTLRQRELTRLPVSGTSGSMKARQRCSRDSGRRLWAWFQAGASRCLVRHWPACLHPPRAAADISNAT